MPIGVKDIIDTFDMPTEFGSPIYKGHRPPSDAACVALLRRAGAVMLGKTATCEFAGMAPPETTNPHNPAHTPGGSSSGSARRSPTTWCRRRSARRPAARCCGQSSYCGIFGFKPTYNSFNKAGVKPAAESIDTIGWLARSLDDIELLTAVLRMQAPQPPRTMNSAPRIGLVPHRNVGQPRSRKRKPRWKAPLLRSPKPARRCAKSNFPIRSPDCASIARETINFHERAACMAYEWDHHREALSPQMRRYIEQRSEDFAAGLHRRLAPHR